MIKHSLLAVAAVAASMAAVAKLPPPDDAAKAKAAETKAKADWQAKVEAYQLCKVQDRIAGRFKGRTAAQQVSTADVKPAAVAPAAGGAAAPAAAPATTGAAPAAGATAAAGAAPAPATGGAPAQPGGAPGTPVATAPLPPCVDPGPFAYAPPEQKPLESSEAHSPAATAAGAPSVRPHSGEFPQQQQSGQQPAKK